MGAFYGSILVKTDDVTGLKTVLEGLAKESKCKFFLGPPLDGWAAVFPDDSGLTSDVSLKIAELIPTDIFLLNVHDDDVFFYEFYRAGQLVDQYSSRPDYFGEISEEEKSQSRGKLELLQDLLADPDSLEKLKRLMSVETKFTFEQERSREFSKLLGLRNTAGSYEYLESGERDEIEGWKQFIHIPDLAAEKAARKAAKAQIAAVKKRLQSEGLLLAEIKPHFKHPTPAWAPLFWGIDSAGAGLVLSAACDFTERVKEAETDRRPFIIQAPWHLPPQPRGAKPSWIARDLYASPSGKWLAGSIGIGDRKARVWEKPWNDSAFEIDHSNAVMWAGFSPDEQWVYSLGGEEFIVSSLAERRPVATVYGLSGCRKGAIHPAGKYAVVTLQDALIVIDLEVKKLTVRWWLGGTFDIRFDPSGEKLLVTTNSRLRVLNWRKLLTREQIATPPEYLLAAPTGDDDPETTYMYTLCFDPVRNLALASGRTGTIQYLNITNGRSGLLLQSPEKTIVLGIDLTSDGQALCLSGGERAKHTLVEKQTLQIWNYPALCKLAGLD